MVFKPKGISFNDPCFKLDNCALSFVEYTKYLGTVIELKGSALDIKRQLCRVYRNANVLISKFKRCSPEVKCQLFNTFCTNLYCPQFWYDGTKGPLKKLNIAYNNSLRRILNIPFYNSASDMFGSLNIPSFYELLRKNINSFSARLSKSTNSLIKIFCTPVIISIKSPIQIWWRKLCYVDTA